MGSPEPKNARGRWPQLQRVEAICYSGYRRHQSPRTQVYPTCEEILEDLRLLAPRFKHLRLYDSGPHAELVLQAIQQHALPFRVMLGANLEAEVSNPSCPWCGKYEPEVLEKNRVENGRELDRAISLAKRYPAVISSVSAGNEATVEWTDHLVPVRRVVERVRALKAAIAQPVTFCENYVPWGTDALAPLVAEVDFLSIHTYPVWELKRVEAAMAYTEQNLAGISARYPGKLLVITEAGWPTQSNGRGIAKENVSEAAQKSYLEALTRWSVKRGLLTFVFEAFDEPWKGSEDEAEPEKHWGLYTVDRRPKLALR